MNILIEKRNAFHSWRMQAGFPLLILLSVLFAIFTGLMAQLSFTLPQTPIPITGQTFAVMLAGVVLGPWGAISQALYALLGFAGIPWFAGMKGGLAALQGPTVGYLIGFIISAYVIGYMVDRKPGFRKFWPLLALMVTVHFIVIMGCGGIYLYGWKTVARGTSPGIIELIKQSVAPFVPGTIIKVLAASALSMLILPDDES